MQNFNFKIIAPHLVAIVVFLIISFAYFTPVLQGKKLRQSDVMNYQGMTKEINDFNKNNNEATLWTNSMFGGMPAYLINTAYPNALRKIHQVLTMFDGNRPASFVFLYLLGFYIALLAFKVDPWLSMIGAIAYAFSSYFFIIIDAGHLTKIMALGYLPPIIAGVYLAYKDKIFLGSILMALFLALQLIVNHLQITYYTLLIILVFGLFQFYHSIREKQIIPFLKATAVLGIAALLAIGSNFSSLYMTYDYGKDSMRGKSELTFDKENKTTGLDKDYATAWSYGKAETITLFIPNIMGGASGGSLSTKSATYDLFKQNYGPQQAKEIIQSLPLYWGAQPFTSGPVYVGAFIFFLFVLGMFLVDNKIKWWIFSATLLSILLAWGHNFMWFTDLFLNYMPGYNKFRTVSMILVIVQFTMPLLGILTVKKIVEGEISKQQFMKAFKLTLGIVGGITLIIALLPNMFFDFSSVSDKQYIEQGGTAFIDALKQDRESILKFDAWRSLFFIVLGAALLMGFMYEKISKTLLYVGLFLVIIIDMWAIDKRYVGDDNFVSAQQQQNPFTPTKADEMILQDKDPNFRVLNVAVNTFNDASTSYFHKSIGGYHGAKMKRYQELIDFQISKNNMSVLNMLNTKYIIVPSKDQGPIPQMNPNALGNAWFVKSSKIVVNADSEIVALTNFNPANEVIIDKRFEGELKGFNFNVDSTASIKLTEYKPNHLTYQSNANTEQLAVFSEIYYDKGWKAFVDGKLANHFRVNYVLRAMRIPEGKHVVEYKFQPEMYYAGNKVSMISSIILLLLFAGIVVLEIKKCNCKK